MSEPIVVDIGAALAALQASPELADMMNDVLGVPRWRTVDSIPTDGVDVWCSFMGQFDKPVYFVARAFGAMTQAAGYASPTHWCPIVPLETA